MMQPVTHQYHDYTITTDKALLQPEALHQWLTHKSYWAKGIPYETVKTAFDHSFVIGVLYNGQQIAFARMITDYATFGYLADVYVEEEHRGRGLSKQMMEVIMNMEWTSRLRRIMLATLDAHELYQQFGFNHPVFPQRLMEITRPDIYESTS